jgi:hypothetical protein
MRETAASRRKKWMRRNTPIIHQLYKAHHKKWSSRPVVHRQIVDRHGRKYQSQAFKHGRQYLFQAFKKPLTVKIIAWTLILLSAAVLVWLFANESALKTMFGIALTVPALAIEYPIITCVIVAVLIFGAWPSPSSSKRKTG